MANIINALYLTAAQQSKNTASNKLTIAQELVRDGLNYRL